MNLPEIRLNIGTHEITLRPVVVEGLVTESLEIISTWHEPSVLEAWTLHTLQAAADFSECDTNYEKAEALFIKFTTGYAPKKKVA
jgi:hypothetical protein